MWERIWSNFRMTVEMPVRVLRYKTSENMPCWAVLPNNCWHARRDHISSVTLQANIRRPYWISTASITSTIITVNRSSRVRKNAYLSTPSLGSLLLLSRSTRGDCSQGIC